MTRLFKFVATGAKPPKFSRGMSEGVLNLGPITREPRCSFDSGVHFPTNEKTEVFFKSPAVLSLNDQFLSLVDAITYHLDSFEFKLNQRVGHGAQGEVFSCTLNDRACVVKVEPLEKQLSLKTEAAFLCLLQQHFTDEAWFSHPIAYFVDAKKSYLVMNNLGRNLVRTDLSYDAIEQFLDILNKLERVKIIHGDIKPGNTLIMGSTIALCDFGLGLNKKMAPGHLYKLHQNSVSSLTDSSSTNSTIPPYLQKELDEAERISYRKLNQSQTSEASTPLLMPVGTAGHIAPKIIRGEGMHFTSYGGDRFAVGSTCFELLLPEKRLAEHYFSDTHSDDQVSYLCSMMKYFEPSYKKISLASFGVAELPRTVEGLCDLFNSDACLDKNPLLFFMHLMVHPDLNFLSPQDYLHVFRALITEEKFDTYKSELI